MGLFSSIFGKKKKIEMKKENPHHTLDTDYRGESKKVNGLRIFFDAFPANTAQFDEVYLEKNDNEIYFIVVSVFGSERYEFKDKVPSHIIKNKTISVLELLLFIQGQPKCRMHAQSFEPTKEQGYVDLDEFKLTRASEENHNPIKSRANYPKLGCGPDYISNEQKYFLQSRTKCRICGGYNLNESTHCKFCGTCLVCDYTPTYSDIKNKKTIYINGQHVPGCEYTEISVGQYEGKFFYIVSQMTDRMNAGGYIKQVPERYVENGGLNTEDLLNFLGFKH